MIVKQRVSTLYIKNISKTEVNLYDIGLRLKPEQVIDLLKVKKVFTIQMLNNSIATGVIRKNITLGKLLFIKNIQVHKELAPLISTKPMPSKCKITASTKDTDNENELLMSGDGIDKFLEEFQTEDLKKENNNEQ